MRSAQQIGKFEEQFPMNIYSQPDIRGHFGPVNGQSYGGSFVSETLVHALDELKDAYEHYRKDPDFIAEYRRELTHFVGRPSPVEVCWAVRGV